MFRVVLKHLLTNIRNLESSKILMRSVSYDSPITANLPLPGPDCTTMCMKGQQENKDKKPSGTAVFFVS